MEDGELYLDSEAMNKAVLSGHLRGVSAFFPRLSKLRYFASHPGSLPSVLSLLPYKSSRLASLRFDICEEAFSSGADTFVRLLAQHAPALTSLAITSPSQPLLALAPHLAAMFEALPHLVNVELPSSVVIHPLVWNALSTLKRLRTLDHDFSYKNTTIQKVHQPKFFNQTFPMLLTLSLNLHHRTLTTLFSSPTPQSLTHVMLLLRQVETAEEIALCLKAVATNCPQLEHLRVHHSSPSPINLDHILSLEFLQRLTCLELIMAHSFSDDDAEILSRAFPNLVQLYLGPSPKLENIDPPTMTIRALLPFARNCLVLKNLSIYVRTSNPPTNPTRDDYRDVRFKSLENLNFTASQVSAGDAFEVVVFLGDICAEETLIHSELIDETHLFHGDPPSTVVERYQTASSEWKDVHRHLTVVRDRARTEAKREWKEKMELEAQIRAQIQAQMQAPARPLAYTVTHPRQAGGQTKGKGKETDVEWENGGGRRKEKDIVVRATMAVAEPARSNEAAEQGDSNNFASTSKDIGGSSQPHAEAS